MRRAPRVVASLLVVAATAHAIAAEPSNTEPTRPEPTKPAPAPRTRQAPPADARPTLTVPLSVSALESQQAEPPSANGGPAGPSGSLTAVQDPEPRSFKIHDLITIQVTESSQATSSGKVKTDKKYDLAAEVGQFWNFSIDALGDDANFSGNQLPGVELGAQKKFDTKGDVNRKDNFTARITAEVIEVRPNGVLVIEAYKHIKNDDEEQTIKLSGECRPEDVDATNIVQSQRLANASIQKLTKGQVRDSSAKGIIAQALDTIFAF